MVNVVAEALSGDAVGTNPLKAPPLRGTHGSAKLDSTTEWLAAKKEYLMVSPFCAPVIISGSNFRPPLPTVTLYCFAEAMASSREAGRSESSIVAVWQGYAASPPPRCLGYMRRKGQPRVDALMQTEIKSSGRWKEKVRRRETVGKLGLLMLETMHMIDMTFGDISRGDAIFLSRRTD